MKQRGQLLRCDPNETKRCRLDETASLSFRSAFRAPASTPFWECSWEHVSGRVLSRRVIGSGTKRPTPGDTFDDALALEFFERIAEALVVDAQSGT
jgi:hypothetical protein